MDGLLIKYTFLILLSQDLEYHNEDNPSKTNKMMRILMFVRILSLIRLARVSRLVRFFNEVEKVSSNARQSSELTTETQSPVVLCADTLTDMDQITDLTSAAYDLRHL